MLKVENKNKFEAKTTVNKRNEIEKHTACVSYVVLIYSISIEATVLYIFFISSISFLVTDAMATEEDEVRALLMRHRKQIIRDLNESKLLTVLIEKGVLNKSNEQLFNKIQCNDNNDHENYGKLSDSPSQIPFIEHLTNGIDEKKCICLIDVIAKNGFEKFKEFCYAIETECPQLIEDLINDRLNGGELCFCFIFNEKQNKTK